MGGITLFGCIVLVGQLPVFVWQFAGEGSKLGPNLCEIVPDHHIPVVAELTGQNRACFKTAVDHTLFRGEIHLAAEPNICHAFLIAYAELDVRVRPSSKFNPLKKSSADSSAWAVIAIPPASVRQSKNR